MRGFYFVFSDVILSEQSESKDLRFSDLPIMPDYLRHADDLHTTSEAAYSSAFVIRIV